MFVHAAQQMGYRAAVLDPDADQPGRARSRTSTSAPTTSTPPASRSWPTLAAAITTEFENVPADALATLARSRPVAPGADAVAICQDRAAEKAHFARAASPARRTR